MDKKFNYSFVTTWKIKAPLSQVWQALYDQEDWPNWWKGVVKVEPLPDGENSGKKMRYTWKSFLPYTLSFDMTSVCIVPHSYMEGHASGELEGVGKWYFKEENGITTVQYTWQVNTTKKWMNLLTPVLKPAFKWNHDVVMRWGGEGLAKKLEAELLQA